MGAVGELTPMLDSMSVAGLGEGWGRFERHEGMISLEAQERLWSSTVAIVGLGGIGGAAAMLCAKAGVGKLVLCDFDRFEAANMVEQCFATADNLGRDKTEAAVEEVLRHHPECRLKAISAKIATQEEAEELMQGADAALVAVDEPFGRLAVTGAARKKGIPCIVPANVGWTAVHSVLLPDGKPYETRLLAVIEGISRNGQAGHPDLSDPQITPIIEADWDIWVVLLGRFSTEISLQILKQERRSYPYIGPAAFTAASVGVADLMRVLTSNEPTFTHPSIFAFDMKDFKVLGWNDLARPAEALLARFIDSGLSRAALVDAFMELD